MMVFPYVHRSFRLTKMAEHGQRALCAVLRNIHAKLERGGGDGAMKMVIKFIAQENNHNTS